jgi:hypothetical protein
MGDCFGYLYSDGSTYTGVSTLDGLVVSRRKEEEMTSAATE